MELKGCDGSLYIYPLFYFMFFCFCLCVHALLEINIGWGSGDCANLRGDYVFNDDDD